MFHQRSKYPLRCFCSRKPILAVYGVGNDLQPYVHIRVFKQHRVYADVLIREGKVQLSCRECFRWHRITFMSKGDKPILTETVKPEEVDTAGSVNPNTDGVKVA